MLRFADGRVDGAVSRDGRVAGAYVHGLFSDDAFRRAFLALIGASGSDLRFEESIDETLDAFAAHCEKHIDIDVLWEIAR